MSPQSVGYNLCLLKVQSSTPQSHTTDDTAAAQPRRKAGISSLTHAAATQVDTILACKSGYYAARSFVQC